MICTEFSASELRAKARREANPRAASRMFAIANAIDGMSRADAARLAGLERQALRDAVVRLNSEGLAGLYDRPKPGRPRRLDKDREGELCDIIMAGPDVEAEGLSAYTLADLVHICMEHWQVSYHPASMSRVVRRLGFSRQKARPGHPKTDEAAQEAFKKGAL